MRGHQLFLCPSLESREYFPPKVQEIINTKGSAINGLGLTQRLGPARRQQASLKRWWNEGVGKQCEAEGCLLLVVEGLCLPGGA